MEAYVFQRTLHWLCIRRPGVTVAIRELERTGLISRRRGSIIILDRAALEKMSNGTYMAADRS